MTCKIDHTLPGALPAILCRECHPLPPAPVVEPVKIEEEKPRRRDLPRTMTPEAWALLEAIERPKAEAKAERFAKFKAKEAERKAADPEAYKLEKRTKARARRQARKPVSKRRRTELVTQKAHTRKTSLGKETKLASGR